MDATNSGDIADLFKQAMEQQAQARFEDALQSYDAILRSNGNVIGAYYNRGFVLLSLQRFDDALESFQRATDLAPDFTEAYVNQGNILKELNRPNEALARYVTFQMAEVAVPSQLFGEILRMIDGLRPQPAPA